MQSEEAYTTLRLKGGGLEGHKAVEGDAKGLSDVSINPVRTDPRYNLSLLTLGRMECLARALSLMAELAPGFQAATLRREDEDTRRAIAISVFASSEIEGEGVAASFIEAFVSATTEPGEHVDEELKQRLATHHAINDTSLTYQPFRQARRKRSFGHSVIEPTKCFQPPRTRSRPHCSWLPLNSHAISWQYPGCCRRIFSNGVVTTSLDCTPSIK